jgi:hypothetical protein
MRRLNCCPEDRICYDCLDYIVKFADEYREYYDWAPIVVVPDRIARKHWKGRCYELVRLSQLWDYLPSCYDVEVLYIAGGENKKTIFIAATRILNWETFGRGRAWIDTTAIR